ncbi:hypothetical protein [Oceanivirga miroungae]|uniref:Uncharacterized protein n=1 Tax=Oceanivirga miroungae TaxID=1130046 RepID=A0A6I8MB37_9FUSO|nr:hypothetical protein [Oceanivirga miroungae]VWL89658.1 hypothetical protein OMES3154_01289 [Oceanivirga miroungae]
MKKFILGIAALVSIGAFAAGYDNAYDTIPTGDLSTFEKIDVEIYNPLLDGVTLVNGDGTGIDKEIYQLKGKFLIPKEIANKKTIVFSDKISNKDELDLSRYEGKEGTDGMTDGFGFVVGRPDLGKGEELNNTPLFMYVYDVETKKVYNVYTENGERGVYRQVISENVDELTPEILKKDDFKFGDGYVEAKDLYKFNIGEIKAKDDTKDATPELDRARHGVTGETVYNYLEKQNKEIKKYIDREVKREVEKYIKEFMKNK